jgi:hypothetical protein
MIAPADEMMLAPADGAMLAPNEEIIIKEPSTAVEGSCDFVQQEIDGEIQDVAHCELEDDALPYTKAAMSADATEKRVVCNALDGTCDFVLVEADHVPIAGTDIEMVPIENDDGVLETRTAIIVDTEEEAAHYGLGTA